MTKIDTFKNATMETADLNTGISVKGNGAALLYEVVFNGRGAKNRAQLWRSAAKKPRFELYIGNLTPIYEASHDVIFSSDNKARNITYKYRSSEEQLIFSSLDEAVTFINSLTDGADYSDAEEIKVNVFRDDETAERAETAGAVA